MLTIDVEYLMGIVFASSYSDRRKVEFPPHPSRLFSAFVAAYEEGNLGQKARNALEWLETLQAPSLYANPSQAENHGRNVLTAYVPINDEANTQEKKGKNPQPEISAGIGVHRLRTERTFPAITPENPHVKFMWNIGEETGIHIPALRSIAEQVTYLGNSMTPVAITISESPATPTLIPDPDGGIKLRTIGKGRLMYLEDVFKQRLNHPGIRPNIGKITAYSIASVKPEHVEKPNKFEDYITFRIDNSQSFPLISTYMILSAARNAFLSQYPDPLPEEISGHTPDGVPSKKHHLAIIAHPNVGHSYADGHIMGFSFLFPKGINERISQLAEQAAEKLKQITLGKLGVVQVSRVYADMIPNIPVGLRMNSFRKKSAVWATITPAVFGKHPRKSAVGVGRDGGPVFHEACEMVGLPKPAEVTISSASIFEGVPLARDFVIPEKFGTYLKTHLMIRFAEPIEGPVILGSGRFTGFGVCKPYMGNE